MRALYCPTLPERSGTVIEPYQTHDLCPVNGADGSGPVARIPLGGPRQSLRVDILPDVRQFSISNGNVEDPVVFKRPIRRFDFPSCEADDQDPVSMRYELGRLWEGSFHRLVSLLK